MQEKCPYFQDIEEGTSYRDTLKVGQRRAGQITGDRAISVFDGAENGKDMSVDVAGECHTRTESEIVSLYEIRAITRACFERLCNSQNHQTCPRFIKKVTDSSPNTGYKAS